MTYPTISERYAKLRARCSAPPAKRRRGGRKPILEPWEIDPPTPPAPSSLRAELEAQLAKKRAQPAPLSGRPQTELIRDLERRLAERVGKPRSIPRGRVDFGNRSLSEDRADDQPEPNMPAGEKMS